VDYEENPALPEEMDIRAGAQFPIWGPLSGSAGYQDLIFDQTVGTMGLAWTDQNGSVSFGLAYDLDESEMLRVVWGFNINY
jgi:hypothetical protein